MNATQFAKELQDGIKEIVGVKPNAEKSRELIDLVFNTIKEKLAEGEAVDIPGFGKFEIRERAARKGRNPQTGAELQIEAKKAPAFKPKKELKEAVL